MIDQLNLNQLRVFAVVYRHRSMTRAAKELHLTQSGVSQHVMSLEASLGQKLFDRGFSEIVPTSAAQALYEGCAKGMGELEQALLKISNQKPSGIVRLGCPPEFGYNILLPLMHAFQVHYESVVVRLTIGSASKMNQSLLNGELDFAFVDDHPMDLRVRTVPVYGETLELCMSETLHQKFGKPRHSEAYYRKLPYVAYFEEEPVLRRWFGHHLGNRDIPLNVRAYLSDAESVSRMVLVGLGAGVLPHYFLETLIAQGHPLRRVRGSADALVNRISIAHMGARTLSVAAIEAMRFFKETLIESGGGTRI